MRPVVLAVGGVSSALSAIETEWKIIKGHDNRFN
jgi:hypothetical protein